MRVTGYDRRTGKNTKILIEPIINDHIGEFYLPNHLSTTNASQYGNVLAVGSDCTLVNIGDIAVYQRFVSATSDNKSFSHEFEKDKWIMKISESDILAVIR